MMLIVLINVTIGILGIIAFVDVRSNHDNRSEGVANVLEKLGAIVSLF